MSAPERDLLDLLVTVNKIETKCRRLNTAIAVPPIVYTKIDELRNQIARWGTENIVEHTTGGKSK
jgi:hypothetical protein